MFCSRPSGIKDFPVERISSISVRSRLSSTPSARRSLSVVAVSSASRPAKGPGRCEWRRRAWQSPAPTSRLGSMMSLSRASGALCRRCPRGRGQPGAPAPGAGGRSDNSWRRRSRRAGLARELGGQPDSVPGPRHAGAGRTWPGSWRLARAGWHPEDARASRGSGPSSSPGVMSLLLEGLDERRCEYRVAGQASEQLAAGADGQLAPISENSARPEKAGERSRRLGPHQVEFPRVVQSGRDSG